MSSPIIIGNWKMNGLTQEAKHIVSALLTYATNHQNFAKTVVCPPFTQLQLVKEMIESSPFGLGAQDCHFEDKGAHTGDISPAMLQDIGVKYVVLGHSERRKDHQESDQLVLKKTIAAQNKGLLPVVCIGETKQERETNQQEKIVETQLKGSLPQDFNGLVAYEPIWAIGTGLTANNDQISEMIQFIRKKLVAQYGENGKKISILYGGSVKPGNVRDIYATAELGGVLVGGVSIVPDDFIKLIDIAQEFIRS